MRSLDLKVRVQPLTENRGLADGRKKDRLRQENVCIMFFRIRTGEYYERLRYIGLRY